MNAYELPNPPPPISRRLVLAGGITAGLALLVSNCQTQPPDAETPPDSPDNPYTAPPRTTPQPSTSPSVPEAKGAQRTAIAASSPNRLFIPSVGITAAFSGAILPEPLPRRGKGLWYNPPYMNQVAWADGCALPSVPSAGTTYLFGHSNTSQRTPRKGVFDQLPAIKPRDMVQLQTALGLFTYHVLTNTPVPFEDLVHHQSGGDFGDSSVPDRAVLITCRIPDDTLAYGFNSVVVAALADAKLL